MLMLFLRQQKGTPPFPPFSVRLYEETSVMGELWHMILERINATSKMLQNPMLHINNAVALLSSLQHFISTLQPQCDIFERRVQELTGVVDFHRKRRPTTHHDDGFTDDTGLNARDNFKIDVIIDCDVR